MTYLTPAYTATWKGTQTSFLLHFDKNVREYKMVTPEKLHFHDYQLASFFKNAINGAPNLAIIKDSYQTSRLATGRKAKIKYQQLLDLLKEQAHAYDSGKKQLAKSTLFGNLSVKFHTLDNDEEDMGALDFGVKEKDEWNVDTPISTVMAHQHSTSYDNKKPYGNKSKSDGSQKVFMNGETWRSLGPNDQRAWNSLTNDAKKKISDYMLQRT